MPKRGFLASGGSACVENSIDQLNRLGHFFLPAHAHLLASRRVDRGFCAVAQLSQLARAEHEPADCDLPALENEVVGAEQRDLDLRLLDPEEILDRLRERAEAIL